MLTVLWHGGVTRTVVLTKRWAIKLPCLVYGWRYFLYGFLANMQEADWTGFDRRLCPVTYAAPGGMFIIMPRCKEVTDEEFIAEIPSSWAVIDDDPGRELPVEMKSCSFGRLNGRIVAVDYGGCGRDGRTTKLVDKATTEAHAR